jgi:hypothetical protein
VPGGRDHRVRRVRNRRAVRRRLETPFPKLVSRRNPQNTGTPRTRRRFGKMHSGNSDWNAGAPGEPWEQRISIPPAPTPPRNRPGTRTVSRLRGGLRPPRAETWRWRTSSMAAQTLHERSARREKSSPRRARRLLGRHGAPSPLGFSRSRGLRRGRFSMEGHSFRCPLACSVRFML